MFPQFDSVAKVQQARGRTRIDYLAEVGLDRAVAIVHWKQKICSTSNPKGCWLFTGSKNTDGYGQVYLKPASRSHLKGREAQQAFLIHVLSYISHHGVQPLGMHISHLCHERSCFNPEHLVAEHLDVNNDRRYCANLSFRPFGSAVYPCTHQPKCIRIIKYFL